MKHFTFNGCLFIAVMLCLTKLNAQGINVQQGAYLKATNNAVIVCNNSGVTGSGTVDLSAATLVLNGGTNTSFGASGGFAVKELDVNKASGKASLTTLVSVSSKVVMQGGLLDLNGNNVVLDSTAVINGENETTRIVGANGGEVIITKRLTAPQSANPGNLGAIITSFKNMGLVTIRRGHKEQTDPKGFVKSIQRYYYVSPANNTQLGATLRLSYLDAELNGSKETTLNLFQSTNNGKNWTKTDATAKNASLNYVERQGIASMAEFTLAASMNTSPVFPQAYTSPTIEALVKKPELKAYPVPATGPVSLLLSGTSDNVTAYIYDANGRMLQQLVVTPGKPAVISNLTPGTYFIKTGNTAINAIRIPVQ